VLRVFRGTRGATGSRSLALVELEFLHEFASNLDTLLSEAAARPKSDLAPLPESLSIVAHDRADLYGEVFPPFVHEAFLISSVVFLDRQFRTYVEGLRRALVSLDATQSNAKG
jgi:hypothetical protein